MQPIWAPFSCQHITLFLRNCVVLLESLPFPLDPLYWLIRHLSYLAIWSLEIGGDQYCFREKPRYLDLKSYLFHNPSISITARVNITATSSPDRNPIVSLSGQTEIDFNIKKKTKRQKDSTLSLTLAVLVMRHHQAAPSPLASSETER